jgi:hypothetical protein
MNRNAHFSAVSAICYSGWNRISTAITLLLLLLLPAIAHAAQATYSTAGKAVESLVSAVRAHNNDQLISVLGPEARDIIFSGDAVADKNLLEIFLKSYEEKHQIVAGKKGSMILVVGKNDWPMPIPVVRKSGKWLFDTTAGKEEILNRRIGRNELSAIQICLAVLDAQRDYVALESNAAGLHEYASRFISEPGKKNGLYWPTAGNEPQSPLGSLVAQAGEEGYKAGQSSTGSTRPFYGYRFRLLTRQGANAPGGSIDYMVNGKLIGGFAIIAWPAEYGNSGVTTFIMNHDGIVYQRNLGQGTAKLAEQITEYDPGLKWKRVEHER